MQKSNQKGFTLIELMIVVAIIGILAAVALPQYQSYVAKSKFAETISAVNQVKAAIEVCAQIEGALTSCDTYGELDITNASVIASPNVTTVDITATTAVVTGTGYDGKTYIITPTKADALSDTTWATTGTCGAAGWC